MHAMCVCMCCLCAFGSNGKGSYIVTVLPLRVLNIILLNPFHPLTHFISSPISSPDKLKLRATV